MQKEQTKKELRKAMNYIQKMVPSWNVEIDNLSVNIDTRENGDVGSSQPGVCDMKLARQVCQKASEHFPKLKIYWATVDEFTYISVEPRECVMIPSSEIGNILKKAGFKKALSKTLGISPDKLGNTYHPEEECTWDLLTWQDGNLEERVFAIGMMSIPKEGTVFYCRPWVSGQNSSHFNSIQVYLTDTEVSYEMIRREMSDFLKHVGKMIGVQREEKEIEEDSIER